MGLWRCRYLFNYIGETTHRGISGTAHRGSHSLLGLSRPYQLSRAYNTEGPSSRPSDTNTTGQQAIPKQYARDQEILTILTQCIHNRDVEKMEQVLRAFRADNPNRHNPLVYRAVLKCYLGSSKPSEAFLFFRTMVTQGYKPEVEDLELLMYNLLRHSDEAKAKLLFESFHEYGLSKRTATYNIWIGYYLREDQPDKARSLFRSMEACKLKPNQSTYLEFLGYFIGRADYRSADKIRSFMKERKVPIDIRFYNGLIDFMSRKQAFTEVESLLEEMKVARIEPTMNTYNLLIRTYASLNRHDKIGLLMEEMRTKNLAPTTQTFNKMLLSMAHVMTPDHTKEILLQMSKMGLSFNSYTYSAIIMNLLKQERYRQAVEMMYELDRKRMALSVESYGQLLKECCDRRVEPAVRFLWLQMRKNEIPPNSYIFSILMRYYLMRRDYARVDSFLLEMKRKWGLYPNPFIFASLLNHYVEILDFVKIKTLLDMIRDCKVEINSVMYNVIMKSFYSYSRYAQGGHITRLKGISLEGHENGTFNTPGTFGTSETSGTSGEPGISATLDPEKLDPATLDPEKLDPATFEPAMLEPVTFEPAMLEPVTFEPAMLEPVTLGFSSEEDSEPMDLSRLKLQFEELFKLPFRPTVHIYNEMMLSFFVRERFKEMFDCLQEMRKSNVVPNKTTFTFLIKARIFEGEIDTAHKLLQEMNRVGFTPTTLHCALVFHSYCRRLQTTEAEVFLNEMGLVYHMRPNHVFYGSLIYAYTRRREYSKVFETFERMEKAGFVPDTETCNYVLISLLEINEYKEARKFFDKMLLQGIKRNTHTYSYLANGLLAKHEDKALLTILADCTAPGNSVDANPFNQTMAYYYGLDRVEELLDVLMLMTDYCVRFNKETSAYVQHIVSHYRKDPAALPTVVKIVKKTLIDVLEDESISKVSLISELKSVLQDQNLPLELAEFDRFVANAEEIRKWWTVVDPDIMKGLDAQFRLENSYQFIPNEKIDVIQQQVSDLASRSPSLLRDVFGPIGKRTS